MEVDTIRHIGVFDPAAFGDKSCTIIGCGATGSRIALSLAKLGIKNIICYDFDIVEEHNVANQTYGLKDIGKKKVDALKTEINRLTDTTIKAIDKEVDGSQLMEGVVFLLTDTMASRKKIWIESLKYNFTVDLVIETRMDVDSCRIYAVNPKSPTHVKRWEDTLYDDDDAAVSACGTQMSVGPTAEIISGAAVWQMIRWFSVQNGNEDILENEIILTTRPTMALVANF